MGTTAVDFQVNMALSLDSFFKGLSDCGLLTTYSVSLKGRTIDITLKEKFTVVTNEFIGNLQELLSKLSTMITKQSAANDDALCVLEFIRQDLKSSGAPQSPLINDLEIGTQDLSLVQSPSTISGSYLPSSTDPTVEPAVSFSSPVKLDKLQLAAVVQGSEQPEVLTICISSDTPNDSNIISMEPILEPSEVEHVTEAIAKCKNKVIEWNCDMCDKTFRNVRSLQDHCRFEHDGRGCFECSICGRRLMNKSSLVRHIKYRRCCFECNICGRHFRNKSSLVRHIKNHLKKKEGTHSQLSQMCSLASDSDEGVVLKSEIQDVTKAITKYEKNGGWNCSMCSKIFKSLSRLTEHCRKEHEGRGSFECNICGTRFIRKPCLVRHIKRHLIKKKGSCSICGSTFNRLDNLATHYKMHVGKPLFKCKTCSETFSTRSQLTAHKKVHVQQQHFVCHQCDKTFTRKDKLKDHIMRHLKIKRFLCYLCDKSYAEKRDLMSHIKNVHEHIFTVPTI